MNYLQLCQRLRQETGIADSGPSQVTGQTGDMKRIVDWVNEAWLRLQSGQHEWAWLWTSNSLAISEGTALYSLPSTLEMVIPGTLYIDDNPLETIDYNDYRISYRSLPSARPTGYSIRPDGQLALNASPDAAYTLSYEGFNKPAAFDEGTDAPGLPARFELLIVWAALIEYGLFDEAPEAVQRGKLNYDLLYAELCRDQLPSLTLAGPIA